MQYIVYLPCSWGHIFLGTNSGGGTYWRKDLSERGLKEREGAIFFNIQYNILPRGHFFHTFLGGGLIGEGTYRREGFKREGRSYIF